MDKLLRFFLLLVLLGSIFGLCMIAKEENAPIFSTMGIRGFVPGIVY